MADPPQCPTQIPVIRGPHGGAVTAQCTRDAGHANDCIVDVEFEELGYDVRIVARRKDES